MSLKKYPYWLKGGLIGLFALALFWLLAAVTPSSDMGNIFSVIIIWPAVIINNLILNLSEKVSIILLPPFFFILSGIVLGWLIGKVKTLYDKKR